MSENLRPEDFPPGAIIVASGYTPRHLGFDRCFNLLEKPPGTACCWRDGVNFEYNWNSMIAERPPNAEWVFIMGDDHTFVPDFLLRLLARQVDVVVPLCSLRGYPFMPVIREIQDLSVLPLSFGKANGQPGKSYVEKLAEGSLTFRNASYDAIDGKEGLIPLQGYATGNAGILIRKAALDKVAFPWFEVGKVNPQLRSSDLVFCLKLLDAGILLHLDTDNTMGHICEMAAWPKKLPDGTWTSELRPVGDLLPGDRCLVVPRDKSLSGNKMDLWTGAFNGYRALNAELTPLQKHQFFVDVCRDFPEVGNGDEDVRAELPLEEMEVLMKKYGIETNRMPGERYMPEESYQIVEKIIQEAEEKKSCRTI